MDRQLLISTRGGLVSIRFGDFSEQCTSVQLWWSSQRSGLTHLLLERFKFSIARRTSCQALRIDSGRKLLPISKS